MQEIVPPKLNKDSGLFSLILSRQNFLVIVGVGLSLLIWSTPIIKTVDGKILAELVIGFTLIPFLFDIQGRPLHKFILDGIKFLFGKKEKRVVLGRDIQDGVVVVSERQFSKVFRIEPVNLSMSSEEEIMAFKQYVSSALFALKNPIQVITVQKYSSVDEGFEKELERQEKLSGILKIRSKQYLEEYSQVSQTMERYFYLVITEYANSLESAIKKLEEQENSFCKLLEQTRIKLIPLSSEEIKDLSDYLLHKEIHENA